MKKIAVAAAALALGVPSAAQAATWRQVTASDGAATDQVSTTRIADGVLHVAWHKGGDLFHTFIGADGRVGATVPIQTAWASMSDPAIVAVPGGLRAFWGGIRTTDTTDPNQDQNSAFSADGGTTWALQPGSIVPIGAQSYGSDVSATTLPSGATLQAWAGTLGTWVHAGLDPAAPNTNFQAALGSYGNYPGLATAANGATTMAWFSSAAAHRGVLAQGVNPDGTPSGAVTVMPGSEVMEGGGTTARTPIAARAKNGGFYVTYALGYPSANQVRVWKVGSSQAAILAEAAGNSTTSVAADTKGRVWAIWSDGTFGEPHVWAARSNRDGSEFGAPVDLGAVRGAHSTYSLDASATTSALDVLALFGTGTSSGGSTYVARTLPGLTLDERHARDRFTFSVTDAGDPVKGAVVKVGKRSGKTDKNGRVKLKVTNRKFVATAKAKNYETAKLPLQ